jgi:hypothetical protein
VTSRLPLVGNLLRHDSQSSSHSAKSDKSQLVDLVVEDHEAEEVERVRARKEGGAQWNESQARHFVRAYPDDNAEEEVREGHEPDAQQADEGDESMHNLDGPVAAEDHKELPKHKKEQEEGEGNSAKSWVKREYDHEDDNQGEGTERGYGSFHEERDAWGSRDDR